MSLYPTMKILKQLCRDHIPPIKGFSKLRKADLVELLKSYNVDIPKPEPKIKKPRAKKELIREAKTKKSNKDYINVSSKLFTPENTPNEIKNNIDTIKELVKERKNLMKKYHEVKKSINEIKEELISIGGYKYKSRKNKFKY
jgi:hypothetical protein